jgi:hypothetical protein
MPRSDPSRARLPWVPLLLVAFAASAGFALVSDQFLTQFNIYVVLSSQAKYCDNVARGVTNPNHTSVVLGLSTVAADATTPRPSPGTYPIVSSAPEAAGNQAQGGFYVSDSACKSALSQSQGLATGGSVTLSAVSDARVAGTFSIDVGTDHVDGTFDTAFCQGLKDEIQNDVTLACQAP